MRDRGSAQVTAESFVVTEYELATRRHFFYGDVGKRQSVSEQRAANVA